MKILSGNILGYVFVVGAVLVTASPGLTDEQDCYGGFYATKTRTEKVFVPAKMDCVKDTSSFADFSSGCRYNPAHYDEIKTTYKEWVPYECVYREQGNAGNR